MKSKIKGILCIAIIVSVIFSFVLVSSATYAKADAALSLNPPSINGQLIGVGGTFTVTANISNISNLWGWSLGLSWNPSILQMINFSEGSFLRSSGQTSVTAAPIDSGEGMIQNINDVLTSQNSTSGSGDIVSFTFQIVGYGLTEISLTNVELLGPAASSTDSNPQIPASITGAEFSNEVQTALSVSPSVSLSDAVFSAVQSGSTSTSNIQLGPSPNPLGSTVQIDVRIDGVSVGFWGWTISALSWNPAVLNLTKVVQGGFLSDNTGSDPASFVGNSKSLWNYTGGTIMGGISEAIQAADTSTDSSGVVATLTFAVVGYGSSPITITGGNLRASSSDHVGTNVTCNSATVNVISNNPTPTPTLTPTPSPTPTSIHSPVASFTPLNGTIYAVGGSVVLDANSSTAGYDNGNCPITNYVWLVEYSNSSILGAFNGKTISFNALSVAALKITLIVTAPDLNPSPSSSYTNTSTTFSWIQVVPAQPLAKIDVSTDKGGVGQNVYAGAYNPLELVNVFAVVTYQGAPVTAGNLVSFAVFYPNGTVAALNVEAINNTGCAYLEFRLPSTTSNPGPIGNWSIVVSVEINSVVLTDSVSFAYNSNFVNVISISAIQLPVSAARSATLNLNVTIQGLTISPSMLSVTICDEQEVPIACYIVNVTSATGGAVTVPVSITIPSWAYVGTATVYANIMTNLPSAGGVPSCPQKTANFQILA